MLDQESSIKSLFQYYQALGVDELYTNNPENWFESKPDFSFKISKNVQSTLHPQFEPQHPQKINIEPIIQTESVSSQLHKCLSLEALESYVKSINDFSIKRTAMNFVFSTGNKKADIMLINDFPFESDDRTGQAYSGDIGVLVRKMMGAIKLDFNELYATYLLPWRPPGNRTPSKKELDFFGEVLKRHIMLKAPKYIFLMGNSTLKILAQNLQANLSKYRMKINQYYCPFSEKTYPYWASYNPNYLQKFPEYKKRAWEDLQFFQQSI